MIYIFDTKVVSELRKKQSGRADVRVLGWSDAIAPAHLYLSVVTIFIIETGIQPGDQADHIQLWLAGCVLTTLTDRILPINRHVAMLFAQMMMPVTRPTVMR